MVRRASRLPPNGKSLEEVVLNRMAHGSASSARRKPSVATSRRRDTTTTTTTTTSAAPPVALENAMASPHSTLTRIEAMATELSELNERLVAVATTTTTAAAQKRKSSTSDRQQIEQFIVESTQAMAAAYAIRKAETTNPSGARVTYDPAHGAHVSHTVRDLRSTARRLDKVFYEVATGDKQRQLAATKLSTLVRGFLVRRRFRKLKYALGQWRARRCGSLLTYLEQFAAREEFLNRQLVRLADERKLNLLRRVVAEIRDVALLNLPLRRERLDETERRFQLKQRALVMGVWTAWKQSALGPRSRKRVTQDARNRHAAARHRLESLERFDVITNEMVHSEFLKENIRVVRGRHAFWVLRNAFSVLWAQEFVPLKAKLARAIAHDRKKLLARVWHGAWLPAFRVAQVDRALSKASERRTLDRFEKHYNLRKIDAHYRATHARKHLRAWALYGQRIRRVRRLFEDTTKETLATLLTRWHVRATYQRALRAHAVENWLAYCRRVFQTPFRVWYSYAAARRSDRRAKESICVAYQRRARRHTKYTFFRLWKHQVLFGNVEAIHSKVHLLRSLEDQKRLCLGLESNARLYQQNIQALHDTIRGLEDQLASKQHELLSVHEATQATRFSVHSAEQSIARVQGMLEAVRQVHPGTLVRIERMFTDYPLLTQDLHEVVALHVAKRREVLAKLSLDGDELEVQNATTPSLGREDQLLLHRVKWVLSRLDLRETKAPRGLSTSGSDRHQAMEQLCALFEFIRTGETASLTRENDPSHPRDLGEETVNRLDLLDASETWHAFLEALTVRFAPERMLQLKERLVKRASEMDEQLEQLKRNHHIYSAYSGSAQPQVDKQETQAER